MMPIKKKALMPPGLLGPLAAVISTAVAFTADAQVQDCARGVRGVIARFAGAEVAASVKIEEIPRTPDGRLVYDIADNGRTIRGSSPTAVCRAFYDNAKSKNAAIATWSGNRFDAAAAFAPSPDVRVEAPVRYLQALNVVTFGYSTPFWSETRYLPDRYGRVDGIPGFMRL